MYLKYITPKKPHQKEPRDVNNTPLLKFFLFIFKYLNILSYYLSYFIVEIYINNNKTLLTERWLSG